MNMAPVSSGLEAAALMFGGNIDHNTANNIRQNYTNFVSGLSSASDMFKTSVMNTINTITSSNVVNNLNNLKLKIGNVFKEDTIKYLNSISEIQTAQPAMQRYIMTHPVIQEKFNKDQCYGYGGEGYIYHKDDYDYNRVINHMALKDEKTGEVSVKHIYGTKRSDQDLELNLHEKDAILTTWQLLEEHLKSRSLVDPTSQWNGLY